MIDIEVIGLAMDTSGLEKGTRALKDNETQAHKTADAVDKVGSTSKKSLDEAGAAAARAQDRFEKLMAAALQTNKSFEQMVSKVGDVENAIKRNEGAANRTTDAVERLGNTFHTGLGSVGDTLNQIRQRMENLTITSVGTEKGLGAVSGGAGKVTNATKGASGATKELTDEMGNLAQSLAGGGGVNGALLSSASRLTGLINPLTGVLAVAASLGVAWYQGDQQLRSFQNTLTMTGNAAGFTANHLIDMAKSVGDLTRDHKKSVEAFEAAAASGRLSGEALALAGRTAALEYAATGKAVSKTVAEFISLGEKPVASALKLNESTNFLTIATLSQISALERQGQLEAATSLTQNTLAQEMEKRSLAVIQNVNSMQAAWRSLSSVVTQTWADMVHTFTKSPDIIAMEALEVRHRQDQKTLNSSNPFDLLLVSGAREREANYASSRSAIEARIAGSKAEAVALAESRAATE